MKVKVIRAASMREAFAEAHRILGPDALILDSRRRGREFEITVALDPEQPPDPANPWRRALSFHGIPADIAAAWADQTPDAAVAGSLSFGKLDFDRPLVIAGPPGAGKTMTTVKLATRFVLAGVRPTVINADQNRAGASAQLAALCRILRAEFIDTASKKGAMRRRPASRRPTLIDLPGMDPFDKSEMDSLRSMVEEVSGVAALVMPAGLDAADSVEIAARFHEAGATALIPTRLDVSRRLGGLVAAAGAVPLHLTEAGTSGRVSDALEAVTPAFLVRRLLDAGRDQEPFANAA
jgi:flagellar biosynthesis protein FlhF